MDVLVPGPTFEDVEPPRPLAADERALVDALVRAGAEPLPGLHDQAADVVVDGSCRCGCSSVRLRTGASAVATAALVGAGSRDGHHLTIEGTAGRGRTAVQVVLHLLDGRLHELEVFRDLGEPVRLPEPDRLRDVRVGP